MIDVTACVLEIFLLSRRSRSSMLKKSMLPPTLSWLVRSRLHAALVEEARQGAVDDRGADLRLDVVADDREALLDEAVVPVVLGGDEHRDAVHEGAAGLEDLLDVPLRGLLGTDGQVGDDDVGLRLLEDADDVIGGAGALLMRSAGYLPMPSWVMPRYTFTPVSVGTSVNLMVSFGSAQIASPRSLRPWWR